MRDTDNTQWFKNIAYYEIDIYKRIVTRFRVTYYDYEWVQI